MLAESRKIILSLIIITLISYAMIYAMFSDEPVMFRIFVAVMVTGMCAMLITLIFRADKHERNKIDADKEIHDNIRKMIDGVIEITKQESNKYRVYTDKDVYLVEYGAEESKLIHLGEYVSVDIRDKK